jgi:hypothetical protein
MAALHDIELGDETMKKADVKIGGRYSAKVTNRKVEIRIDAEKPRGGWEATNLATGKKIQIKSAQRLQGEVTGRKGRAKVTTEGNLTVVENEPAAAETVGAAESTSATKKPRKAKSQATDGTKKLSAIDAAAKVLSETGTAMNAKELVDAMSQKKLWTSPGGKTPHATLYSAILREISTKGGDSRFVKSERGKFARAG